MWLSQSLLILNRILSFSHLRYSPWFAALLCYLMNEFIFIRLSGFMSENSFRVCRMGGGGGGGVQHSSVLFFHIIWSVVKTAVITGVY